MGSGKLEMEMGSGGKLVMIFSLSIGNACEKRKVPRRKRSVEDGKWKLKVEGVTV